ncbi:MAG TPA: tetratricopeptide repeat protein, partial [Flavisolibacter sp.]|nr:tetratricopeptide repeat protein [Flavisolibacter sp.]
LAEDTKEPALKSAAYYNQGVAYTKSKELEKSIDSYKKALLFNPNDQEARENLQKALLELKQKQQQKKNQDKQKPKMNNKDAEQKLKMLEQKEKNLQQRLQNQNKQKGGGQREDW